MMWKSKEFLCIASAHNNKLTYLLFVICMNGTGLRGHACVQQQWQVALVHRSSSSEVWILVYRNENKKYALISWLGR